jgi:hypothetical protein
MFLVLLIACLALGGCADLPQFNQGAEATFQAVNLVDIMQSVHGAASDSCYREVEPITRALIGSQPSSTAVVVEGVGYGLVHYGITQWLTSHGHDHIAAAWEVVTLGGSAYSVGHNYQIGIRIGAPNTDEGYRALCQHY